MVLYKETSVPSYEKKSQEIIMSSSFLPYTFTAVICALKDHRRRGLICGGFRTFFFVFVPLGSYIHEEIFNN